MFSESVSKTVFLRQKWRWGWKKRQWQNGWTSVLIERWWEGWRQGGRKDNKTLYNTGHLSKQKWYHKKKKHIPEKNIHCEIRFTCKYVYKVRTTQPTQTSQSSTTPCPALICYDSKTELMPHCSGPKKRCISAFAFPFSVNIMCLYNDCSIRERPHISS